MNNYLNDNQEPILISHFPGTSYAENLDALEEMSETQVVLPNNVEIVTVLTKDFYNDERISYLKNQLENNNINFINPLVNKNVRWSAARKAFFILEGLKKVKSEYTLILDGKDTVICGDLSDIVNKFNTYNKDIIFNATIWNYPNILIDTVNNREEYGKYCYLNAGCCFGKTEALIDFYTKVVEEIRKDEASVSSEQYYVRKVFNKMQDTVFFDYDCKIFQIWHKRKDS